MPRPRRIWWRESKGCYFTTIEGVQHRLAKQQRNCKKLQRGFSAPGRVPRTPARVSG